MNTDDIPPRPRSVAIVENLMAPEIFAHGVPDFAIGNGVVTVTLTSRRWDNSLRPPREVDVVIGRLTMPIHIAEGLVVGLGEFLASRKAPLSDAEKRRMQ